MEIMPINYFQTRLNIWHFHNKMQEFILHCDKCTFGPYWHNASHLGQLVPERDLTWKCTTVFLEGHSFLGCSVPTLS